jgi:hypothetical protein
VCACPRLSKRENERVIKTVDQIVIPLFIITKNIRSSTPIIIISQQQQPISVLQSTSPLFVLLGS